MSTLKDPSRRQVLVVGTGAVVALATGTAGCAQPASNNRMLSFESLEQALLELRRLTRAAPLPPATAWSWVKTLHHCAQSVEYSMSGFPQMRSPLFRATVGGAAFRAFVWQGRMTHDLGEPIPGAPALAEKGSIEEAVARMTRAAENFSQWTRPLQPHFAYGELSKAEYEQAHAMHLANHFSAFEQQPAA